MKLFSPEEIVELRESLGLTRAEFAKAAKVSRQTVWFWETGAAHPQYDQFLVLNDLEARIASRLTKVG